MKKIFLFLLLFSHIESFTQQLAPITWTAITVKDPQQSCGFIDVADFNNDGKKEIVMSTLIESGSASSPWSAKGAMRVFTMPGSGITGTWTEQTVLPLTANLPFINAPQALDVDEDGVLDLVVNQGFIQTNGGSHFWMKGPAYTQTYNFAPQTTHGSTYYFWHEVVQFDLDGDGKKDIITTSAQTQDATNNNNGSINPKKAKIEWYRHLGNGNFQYHLLNDSLGGVFLKLHDIDHDGDQDIVVSQFFWGTSRPALVWLENINNPSATNTYTGTWNYHVIDNTTGLGYYFDFYDLDLDGKEELVYDNHNNQNNSAIKYGTGPVLNPGIYYFDIPANPATSSQWPKTKIYDGFRVNLFDFGNPASQGSPGIFSIGDLDGNGYPDIVVPGDGNDTLYLFRQKPGNIFVKETVDLGKMFGMAMITDLDGDGKKEIVAAKHNFPTAFQILSPPAGFLKIYKPNFNCTTQAASINSSGAYICQNDSLTLTSNSGSYYVWGPNQFSQNIWVNTPGNYSVVVTNSVGCSSTASISITNAPINTASITLNGNILSSQTGDTFQWYFNGSPISGATSNSYTATAPGNYVCEIFFNGNNCSYYSNTISITTTNIEKYKLDENISIFPNPSSNFINIQFINIDTDLLSFTIFDVYGKKIIELKRKAEQEGLISEKINISDLIAGLYFLRIESKNIEKTIKIIKH